MPVPPENARYIDVRSSHLSQLLMLWIERVLKYLFLTNAGGAIAVLSFMGASQEVRAMASPKWALGCFLVGVFLVGVLSAYQLQHSANLNTEWRNDVQDYLAGQITWEKLIQSDKTRSYVVTSCLGYLLSYGSFLCFVVGSAIGFFLLVKS
jgi:hypothetical protein